MEDAFNKLKKDHQNTVDNLVKWMKDSNIVDGSKLTEENARKLFENVSDSKNVDIDKFKEAISKAAAERDIKIEDVTSTLAKEAPKFLNAAKTSGAKK